MNADKILPILCRYLKDTDNHLLASLQTIQSADHSLQTIQSVGLTADRPYIL